jgi:hypothetical protein
MMDGENGFTSKRVFEVEGFRKFDVACELVE